MTLNVTAISKCNITSSLREIQQAFYYNEQYSPDHSEVLNSLHINKMSDEAAEVIARDYNAYLTEVTNDIKESV